MKSADREFYEPYADALDEAFEQAFQEMRRILDEFATDPEERPFEHIKSRLKDAGSTVDKLVRSGLEATSENALARFHDVIGLRIVTHFVGDIYAISDKIARSGIWKVVEERDYIARPKPNGYRSLHIIAAMPFEGLPGDEIQIEIQLRTIAMDCWASLEHQLQYKKNLIGNTALIEEELKRCSDEMASTDLSMQTIRDVIRARSGE